MDGRARPTADAGWTRAGLIRAALGGGALVAGGAALADRTGGAAPLAAQARPADAEILNFFLLLEYVQEAFYREALRAGRLEGDLLTFAETVGEQESEHVAFLAEQLGSRAEARPTMNFEAALSTPERFRAAAVELEEAAVAGYVGQGANLSRDVVRPVATLVSVEARQAAWIRDLAGVSPAPRAADKARTAEGVLADLRERGFVA
jgi:Ferritin-like domain